LGIIASSLATLRPLVKTAIASRKNTTMDMSSTAVVARMHNSDDKDSIDLEKQDRFVEQPPKRIFSKSLVLPFSSKKRMFLNTGTTETSQMDSSLFKSTAASTGLQSSVAVPEEYHSGQSPLQEKPEQLMPSVPTIAQTAPSVSTPSVFSASTSSPWASYVMLSGARHSNRYANSATSPATNPGVHSLNRPSNSAFGLGNNGSPPPSRLSTGWPSPAQATPSGGQRTNLREVPRSRESGQDGRRRTRDSAQRDGLSLGIFSITKGSGSRT
jgi:hypothetical protein